MLCYRIGVVWPGHPTLFPGVVATEEEQQFWDTVVNDPVCNQLWMESTSGVEVAQKALRDYYEEHGIYEKKEDQ